MARDIQLIQNPDNSYDIDFENGDFKLTDGLDSAILMSIFCEQRASVDEVPEPIKRRGHFTNIFNNNVGYEIGSKFWLFTEQARNTDRNLSNIEDTLINDGFQWMLDDGIVKDVELETVRDKSTVFLEINLTNNSDIQTSKYVELFNNTFR